MYKIRYDRATNIFFYSMTGFWTMETVERFLTDLRAEAARIRRSPMHFDTLCDSTAFPVQSMEVSEALGKIMDAAIELRTGRTAIAVGSMLGKLQAERTLPHPSVKVFLSLDEARAWLKTPEAE